MNKMSCCVVGATGMVGQRFLTLLENHPYFEVTCLAASARSAGRSYREAVGGRWKMSVPMPEKFADMTVLDAADADAIAERAQFVFCAVNMPKDETKALEEDLARHELPVISNNSANRWTPDVPMIMPEINASHAEVIAHQRARLGTKRGFIAVKPNCSIQSYVPMLSPLREFGIKTVVATTYQAISGAGKTFNEWREMIDNVIPYIGGEEEKSEKEPLRIWGEVKDGVVVPASEPLITTQCIRVPVTDGHTAAVFVSFERKPTKEEILDRWAAAGCRRSLSCRARRSSSLLILKRTTARRRRLTACFTAAWEYPSADCAPTRCSTGSSSGFRTTRCAARRAVRY